MIHGARDGAGGQGGVADDEGEDRLPEGHRLVRRHAERDEVAQPVDGVGVHPVGRQREQVGVDASTDVLVEDANGNALLAEIELRLPNLFSHQHPMSSYDLVIVWELGGLSNGDSRTVPCGTNGAVLPVTLLYGPAPKQWLLKWGTVSKSVIVLKDVL